MTGDTGPLRFAARDADGELILRRVQGRTGQWFLMPTDASGSILSFWSKPGSPQDEDAFHDDDGNVLVGVLLLHTGMTMTMSLDASLRPVAEVTAIVSQEVGTVSPNPGGWPLTEEELDRAEPPPDDLDVPRWRREATADVARDELGQQLTTRVRASDGGWADALMTADGRPLAFDVDLGVAAGGEPLGETERVTLMRALGGLVVMALADQGRPIHSVEGVSRLRAEARAD